MQDWLVWGALLARLPERFGELESFRTEVEDLSHEWIQWARDEADTADDLFYDCDELEEIASLFGLDLTSEVARLRERASDMNPSPSAPVDSRRSPMGVSVSSMDSRAIEEMFSTLL